MKKLIVILVLMFISCNVFAREVNIILHTTSWHSDKGFYTMDDTGKWSETVTKWNGNNKGMAIEYGLTPNYMLMLGYMKNSFNKNMVYGGLIYKHKFWNFLDIGVQGGLIKSERTHNPYGYRDGKLLPLILPYISLGYGNYGINIIYEPGGVLANAPTHVFAIQWKLKFDIM